MRRALLVACIVVAAAAGLSRFLPEDPKAFGLFTLVPSAFLIVYIFWTKRILEALILASLMGFLMVHRGEFFGAFEAKSNFDEHPTKPHPDLIRRDVPTILTLEQ